MGLKDVKWHSLHSELYLLEKDVETKWCGDLGVSLQLAGKHLHILGSVKWTYLCYVSLASVWK